MPRDDSATTRIRMLNESPHHLAERLEERFRPLEIEFHRRYWESQVEASSATEGARAESELELRRAKGDAEAYAAVKQALDDEVHEPMLLRQLEVLRLSLAGNQMDEDKRTELVETATAVEGDFASYRPEVDGERLTDNQIEDILRTSDDDDFRRKVWEESKEIGGIVASRVRELARIRNAAAHALGYPDYYRMSLDLQELSEDWLFGILEELERVTNEPFERWKAELDRKLTQRFGVETIYPWHYSDPFFQSLPPDGAVNLDDVFGEADAAALAKDTFGAWGLDLSGVIAASDLYPRERKCQHAFCIDVDRTGGDVRILANIVPGEHWVGVMLHESGHAAYDVAIDPDLPYLLHRHTHIFVTEAMAMLSGRLMREPQWLRDHAGVDEDVVRELAPQLREAQKAQLLLFARWTLVMSYFERELYSDPESDLDTKWWDLVSRFQRVAPPTGRSAPDWAAKVHVAVAPVYYQNYILGEMLASQLRATCERECGGLVGVPAAGDLLKQRVFSHGALLRWDSLIEAATGGPLSTDGFVADIS